MIPTPTSRQSEGEYNTARVRMRELCASVLTWFCIITVCLKSTPYAGSPPLYTFLAAKMIDYSVVSIMCKTMHNNNIYLCAQRWK